MMWYHCNVQIQQRTCSFIRDHLILIQMTAKWNVYNIYKMVMKWAPGPPFTNMD